MKRENGAGSVYQRKDGRWVAKVWDPVQRKHVTKYAATKNKAEGLLREMLNRVQGGRPPIGSGLTFKAYATAWLEGPAGRRRAPSTVHEYRSRLSRHAYPVIGHLPMNRIHVPDIERVLDRAASSGLGLSAVRALKNAIGAVFAEATKDRSIAANPCKGAELPLLPPPKTVEPPSTEAVVALLEQARALVDDDEAELGRILIMCANTGARIGEVLAARWEDLTPDLAKWRVRSTISKDQEGRLIVGGRTKNGDARTVEITDDLRACLAKQREFVAYRRATSRLWVDEGWIFPTSTGTVRDSHNLRSLLKRTFPEWPYAFHGIRHWFVSLGLTASGAGLVQVARLVGHRSTRTTQDIYGHLLDEGAQEVLDVVSKALNRPPKNR
jgi:integrase